MEKKIEKKPAAKADEVRDFSKGRLELVKIGSVTFGRAVLEPGWKWSESVKPIVGVPGCIGPHTQCHISGRLHVVIDDVSEEEFGLGDVSSIPPGRDPCVLGDEPAVVIDVTGIHRLSQASSVQNRAA